jgi:hypothetical protein
MAGTFEFRIQKSVSMDPKFVHTKSAGESRMDKPSDKYIS